jgi:hypothetical protein
MQDFQRNLFSFFKLPYPGLMCLLCTVLIFSACDNDDDEPGPVEPPILLCEVFGLGNLDENRVGATTFTFENNPNAPVDYVIDCFPRVLVDATIEPGTVIEFGEDAGLYILGDGSLSASGTAADPIIMRGTNSAKGWWRGIAFGESDIRNELNYVTIDGAGGRNTIQGGEFVALFDNTEGLKVQNTTISNSNNYGFIKTGSGNLGAFSNNSFIDNEGFPLYIHANKLHQLDGTDSKYTGNGMNMIRMAITGGSVLTVLEDQTWPKMGVPVLMDEGTLGIIADLLIQPGFEMVLRPDCAISVDRDGSLNAVGTAEDPITFRGEEDIQGYWEFLYLEGNSALNQLTNVKILNGGRLKPFGAAPANAALFLASDADGLLISNSEISKSAGCGIYTSDAMVTLQNNTYADNADGDVCP